jgi:hypothetical protein
MKMEERECSETPAYKIQTSGNRPKARIKNCAGIGLLLQKDLGSFMVEYVVGIGLHS